MSFIFILAFLFLLFSHLSLRERVNELEKKAKAQTEEISSVPWAAPVPQAAPFAENSDQLERQALSPEAHFPSEPFSVRPIPMPPEQEKQSEDFFLYVWFREQTLIKVGSIIFFLGAVWFVSYAIEQNWISPFMRIMLGLLLAIAIYVVGVWRSTIEPIQYQVLTTLGTGVFLGTVIASQFAFPTPIFPPTVALLLMVSSIGYTLWVAIKTKTQWLGVAASVAGFLAPLLVGFAEPLSGLLLTYTFFLSVGFVMVVFFTAWRAIPLVLVVGSTLYLSLVYEVATLSTMVLWFFVVLFSLLFCISTAISIWRTNDPDLFDVSILTIITLQFMLYADAIALLPDLALFVAAAVMAFVGYALRQRGVAANGVSVFVASSLACSLIGTAALFDGFVLTIAYAIEALVLYVYSLRLATVIRSVVVAALLFILPVVSGMANLAALSPQEGLLHVEMLGVFSVIFALGYAVVYTVRSEALRAVDWLRQIAGVFLTVWYLFTLSTCVVVGEIQTVFAEEFVTSLLLSTIAIMIVVYVLQVMSSRSSWQGAALLTLLAPTVTALVLLSDSAWSMGIWHESFLGALFYFLSLVTITVLYWIEGHTQGESSIAGKFAYGLLWVIIGYGFLFLATIWEALLMGEEKRVVTAVSYTIFIYLVMQVLLFTRARVERVLPITLVLVVPGTLLLSSLSFLGWSEGLLSIDAIGLYVTTTLLFLLGSSLLEYRQYVEEDSRVALQTSAQIIYGVAGGLIFALVWIMSQTVFAESAIAVTVALFVYTVAGLLAYSRGRMVGSKSWRRIGVMLLSAVILRLALVDVWGMDLVWRIFTFLGIGLLFIITALVERSQTKEEVL